MEEQKREVVSIFSGGMGLDLGLEKAGLSTAVCVELDPNCIRTINRNRPKIHTIQGDIKDILRKDPTLDSIKRLLNNPVPFAVVGGPPCQSFSTAGKRGGLSDIRGTLLFDFIRVVGILQPEYFVMENVKGLLQHVIESEEGKLPLTGAIESQFQECGYMVSWGVMRAVDFGVAQTRERVIFIGSRTGIPNLPVKGRAKRRSLEDEIRSLEKNPGIHARFSPKTLGLLKFIPEGGNWKKLPRELLGEALGGALKSGGGKVGFFRRLAWDKPAPTLVTSPIQKATLLCHPNGDRPLSVSEYAKLQGFPKGWKFEGNMMAQYRQIGNAVPVKLGRVLGRHLLYLDTKALARKGD